MNNDTLSLRLGRTAPLWAPADAGAGGGSGTEGDDTGNETPVDVEAKASTDGTVLGSEPGTDPDGSKNDDAAKDKKDDGKDEKSDADGKKDDEKDEGAEVPEDGKYDFELPDGVELEDEKKDFWSGQFKEIGLTRAQAQKLIELQSGQLIDEQKAFAEAVEKQQKEHLAAAKKDKDIGGDKWAESARLANLGLKTLGGSAIKDLILSTGNGNNPEMIRELRRIGEMVKDDKFEPGASHEAPVATEKSWYGETTPDTKKG